MRTALNSILSFLHRHRGYIDTGKILIIAVLSLISLFVSVYVLWSSPWTGFRFIYVFIPHLYLIPIILLSLWYPKSGIRLLAVILVSVIFFWLFADIIGYTFSIAFVMLYTGLDLALIMVLLLYVKDRRLVEAVITDLIERRKGEGDELLSEDRFGGDFDSIIAAFSSEEENEREEAVQALSGLSDERVVFPLISALKDNSPFIRRAAVEALGKSVAQKAVRPLIQSLTDDDRYVREAASEALGHLGDLAVPTLIREFENLDWRIRMGCVIAVRVSSAHLPTFDGVIQLLKDESVYVRREAVKTLGRIGDQTVFPYIVEATKDQDASVRLRAVRAVARIGSHDEAISVLKRCTQDSDGGVRVRAGEEMKKIQGREG